MICIPTYRRPKTLSSAFEAIAEQVGDSPAHHQVRVVIIDNDVAQSARAQVEALAEGWPAIEIEYLTEPRTGIGHVRNRGFSAVRGDEWLIFFDDDQIPTGSWLSQMLKCRENPLAQVIFGPVTPLFDVGVPDWGRGGWAWGAQRARLIDGRRYDSAGFGNVMFSSDVLKSVHCRVPQAFTEGPGEDTAVSLALTRAGFGIVYCAGASARETVGASRMNMTWVVERARASGTVWRQLAIVGLVPSKRVQGFALKAVLDAARLQILALIVNDNRGIYRARSRQRLAFAVGTLGRTRSAK